MPQLCYFCAITHSCVLAHPVVCGQTWPDRPRASPWERVLGPPHWPPGFYLLLRIRNTEQGARWRWGLFFIGRRGVLRGRVCQNGKVASYKLHLFCTLSPWQPKMVLSEEHFSGSVHCSISVQVFVHVEWKFPLWISISIVLLVPSKTCKPVYPSDCTSK